MKRLEVVLKPFPAEKGIERLEVLYKVSGLTLEAGKALCGFQTETVSIPGCIPAEISITDELGNAEFELKESVQYPYRWLYLSSLREISDKFALHYTVKPRVLDDKAACGPYFDLRNEDGGANGAGIHFLPEINDFEGSIALSWDMSQMPEGSIGVCTWGEGNLSYEGKLEKLRQCYFAFGAVKKITDGDFGYYWLSEPTFDVNSLAEYTKELFKKMQLFFKDNESVYRIFMRKDPFKNSGGTALLRSYMFGWNETQPVSVRDKQNILAHEMVHNWPQLNDVPYGTASWYSEGTAEYYCCMLPFRNGLIDRETLLNEIQTRATSYYTNPTRHMENIAAAQICWQDRRAQRLPYGRGIFFLANTDVKLRRATNGKVSIDDVVLAIIEKDRAGVSLGNQLFIDTVKQLGGIDITDDFELMRTGGHIVPLEDAFDAQFRVCSETVPEADTGKPVTSYKWTLR